MQISGTDYDNLKQVLANYEQLWAEWQEQVGDGSWSRTEVENNLDDLREIISRYESTE